MGQNCKMTCEIVVDVYSDFGAFRLLWLQHILYRQKEQFSDGVGYSWIDGLKHHAASQVSTPPLRCAPSNLYLPKAV